MYARKKILQSLTELRPVRAHTSMRTQSRWNIAFFPRHFVLICRTAQSHLEQANHVIGTRQRREEGLNWT